MFESTLRTYVNICMYEPHVAIVMTLDDGEQRETWLEVEARTSARNIGYFRHIAASGAPLVTSSGSRKPGVDPLGDIDIRTRNNGIFVSSGGPPWLRVPLIITCAAGKVPLTG